MKIKLSKYFVFISILSFFAVFIFVVQTSYNKLYQSQRQLEEAGLLKTLDPNIEGDIISTIKEKKEYQPESLINIPLPTQASPSAL